MKKIDADDLLNAILQRKKRVQRNRCCRKNITDFIAMLSHYVAHGPENDKRGSHKINEYIYGKLGDKPYGYTVRIAIEKLPGKLNKIK